MTDSANAGVLTVTTSFPGEKKCFFFCNVHISGDPSHLTVEIYVLKFKLTKCNRSPEELDLKNVGSDVRFSKDN